MFEWVSDRARSKSNERLTSCKWIQPTSQPQRRVILIVAQVTISYVASGSPDRGGRHEHENGMCSTRGTDDGTRGDPGFSASVWEV